MIPAWDGKLTNASRFERALLFASLLFTRPGEVLDRVARRIEYRLEKRRTVSAAYEGVGWEVTRSDLHAYWKQSEGILEEPEAHEIERQVWDRLATLRTETLWDIRCNADLTLARCLYLACRVLRPITVVETGVAYGVSTAFILKALEVNRQGRLYSVDLPFLVKHATDQVGVLVPEELRTRWELHRGASRRKLPSILKDRKIDIFVHDSLHSYTNMRYEFATVWPSLRPGGVLVADDVQGNAAYDELKRRGPAFWRVVRQDAKDACFGVAIK